MATVSNLAPALRPRLLSSEKLPLALAQIIFSYCSPFDGDLSRLGRVSRFMYQASRLVLHNLRPDASGSISPEWLAFYLRVVTREKVIRPALQNLTSGLSLPALDADQQIARVRALHFNCTAHFHNRVQPWLLPPDYAKQLRKYKGLEITALSLRFHSTNYVESHQHFFSTDLSLNCPKLTTLVVKTNNILQLQLLIEKLPRFSSLESLSVITQLAWNKNLFAPLQGCPKLRALTLEHMQLSEKTAQELFALITKLPTVKKIDCEKCQGPVDQEAVQKGKLTRSRSFVILIPPGKR